MSTVAIEPARRGLSGTLTVPGDKSIAHRGLLLGAIARGASTVHGFVGGADNRATLDACRLLGVTVEERGGELRIEGRGWGGLRAPAATIDCRNSGTTMRMLTGMLAGRPFASRLDGDASLRRRPMQRVLEPLARMGATIASEGAGGRAPLVITGRGLVGAAHRLSVASAQVKSALLLAGLQASGETRVAEPAQSRDHTERLLRTFGARLERQGGALTLAGPQELTGAAIDLPGDFSSAAFLIVAALVVPGSELRITGVGVNPTRTGLLDALAAMGASIEVEPERGGDEPRATLLVRSASLRAARVGGDLLLRAIDEFPILCVAAAAATGTTEIHDAGELRLKESDRVAVMAEVLRAFGARVEEQTDGLVIEGPTRWRAAQIDSRGDHRVAMAAAVLGLVAPAGVTIAGGECADVSFPGFYELVARACGKLVIAIDGPAGAGKSTAARELAARLGYAHIDSGAMYRAVGLAAQERGIDPGDAVALARLVDALDLRLESGDAQHETRVLLDGRDVSAAIRTAAAGEWASRVAPVPEVRTRLVVRQRALAQAGGVVMDGRDIGTVVFPNADCKFFVTASAGERARRRRAEQEPEAAAGDLSTTQAEIEARDRRDRERAHSPLLQAADAVVIDTDALTPDAVVTRMLEVVQARARP